MKTKDIIQQAEHFTVAHIYGDGTALYDLSVGDKAYSIRVKVSDFSRLRFDTLTNRSEWQPLLDNLTAVSEEL